MINEELLAKVISILPEYEGMSPALLQRKFKIDYWLAEDICKYLKKNDLCNISVIIRRC